MNSTKTSAGAKHQAWPVYFTQFQINPSPLDHLSAIRRPQACRYAHRSVLEREIRCAFMVSLMLGSAASLTRKLREKVCELAEIVTPEP